MYKTFDIDIDGEVFSCILKKKKRKTLSIKMKEKNKLEILMPAFSLFFNIEKFLEKNKEWILKNNKKLSLKKKIFLDPEILENKREGFFILAKALVGTYALKYGFEYKDIKIKDIKSRWGSCSTVGNINLNYRIFLLDDRFRDYVIFHELCHTIEMNHSAKFWKLVSREFPDYKKIRGKMRNYLL